MRMPMPMTTTMTSRVHPRSDCSACVCCWKLGKAKVADEGRPAERLLVAQETSAWRHPPGPHRAGLGRVRVSSRCSALPAAGRSVACAGSDLSMCRARVPILCSVRWETRRAMMGSRRHCRGLPAKVGNAHGHAPKRQRRSQRGRRALGGEHQGGRFR
ncbi:hypothetical protein PYCCODRAFT_788142 [Trametes coccinea BRFM310]|uniref:Uncharacterized protein n=1 Tax=Trametes coccinea (strain BRFM310) TaxID=1353009 RepID=A0A1Y2J0T6_TRAC3|nr:hypothetical protein PYCCODRAFT_788142 [Trametes coccinea BRFM310]